MENLSDCFTTQKDIPLWGKFALQAIYKMIPFPKSIINFI